MELQLLLRLSHYQDENFFVTIDGRYDTDLSFGLLALDGNTNLGAYDIFLIKYDTSGSKQWTKLTGTSSTINNGDYPSDIVIDSSDNIYITGTTTGNIDGNDNSSYDKTREDIFVIKYNTSGAVQWTIQDGSSFSDYAESVTVDSSGNVVVTGKTTGKFDGNTIGGSYDYFIVKYNSSGTKQ